MFDHLDIYDPRERWLVGMADAALAATVWPLTWVRQPAPGKAPRRILLLRLERIGDFLMSLGAIRAVRDHAPDAVIDLVVGSWNAELAQLVPGIDRGRSARHAHGSRAGMPASRARACGCEHSAGAASTTISRSISKATFEVTCSWPRRSHDDAWASRWRAGDRS